MKKLLVLFIILAGLFKISHEHNNNTNKILRPITKLELKNELPPIFVDYNKYLGTRYKWGGTNIKKGLDCSSFTQHVFKDNNIEIPRNSREQAKQGSEVEFKDLRRGDLLFFSKRYDLKTIGHVSLYIGNNQIIHAVTRGVVIDSIGDSRWNNYWEKRLLNIRRIEKENV